MDDLESLVNSMNSVFRGGNFRVTLDNSDEQGTAERFSHMASRYGEVYEKLLDWKLEFHRILTPHDFEVALEYLSRFADTTIADIENYVTTMATKINDAPEAAEGNVEPNINLMLVTEINPDAVESFERELAKFA